MRLYLLFPLLALFALTAESANDNTGRAGMLRQRADSFYYEEKLPQALEAYIEGLKAAEDEGDTRAYVACTGYIGNIYEAYSDHASSLKYYHNGYQKAVEMADTSLLHSFLSNLVKVYCRQGDLGNARHYFEEMKQLKPRTKLAYRQYTQMYNQAMLLNVEGRHEEAIEMHHNALDFSARNGMDSIYQLFQSSEIGLIYLQTRQLEQAIAKAGECAGMAQRLHSNELLANAYKILADAYLQLGMKEEAETYRSLYSEVSDSVYDMNSFYQLRGRLADYENEKINEKISGLNATINRQWQLLLAVALCLVALTATFIVMEYRRRRDGNSSASAATADGDVSTATADDNGATAPAPLLNAEQEALLSSRIKDVLADVDVISQQDFSMQMLCELVRSNSRYVSHIINENYHKNFNALLNELRIAEAARRLTDHEHYGHMTIQAIYEDLGYTNAMSFNRAFKRIMGGTPSSYQKERASTEP